MSPRLVTIAGALAAALAGSAGAQDAGKGEAVFKRCAVCHSAKAGSGPSFGPLLAGVVGRKAGSVPGFLYSPAMAGSGIVWDAATLDAFIAKPQSVVKGTRMTFPGLPEPEARADLIAYLATLN